ncbi:MAG: hypothetical protein F4244_02765 [Gammaproteobacteria bacterium]|nr:hypothetical protein [Gammaproteobacteria bacterium]
MIPVLLAWLVVLPPHPAEAFRQHREVILAGEWPEPELGPQILALPQIREILKAFDETGEAVVEIRFPGGETGRAWAQSVADWMTAFGVPRQYLVLLPGSGAPDRLVLEVIENP